MPVHQALSAVDGKPWLFLFFPLSDMGVIAAPLFSVGCRGAMACGDGYRSGHRLQGLWDARS